MAERDGCAMTDRSLSKLRTRQFDPKRAFPFDPGTEGMRQDRPFKKETSNASARPGAQHSSQAIERREST